MEFNKKAFDDTVQLFSKYNDEDKNKEFLLREDMQERLQALGFNPGKKIYIEAEVTDRYFSQMLFSMLYSESENDGSPGLEAMGIRISQISWDGVAYFSPTERDIINQAINLLQQKLNPRG